MEIKSFLAFLCLTASQKFEVRKQVVERIMSGDSVASTARSVPFTARTIYRWVVRFSLGGFNNLKDRKRTGRPRKWTEEHAEWIYKVVVDRTPQQCKFEFALWTAQRLRQALWQEFGVRTSIWTVRRILRMLGLTPQRPKRRSVKYSPAKVKKWKDEKFPRIVKRAKELGATIVFADESGLSSQCVYGRTWGIKGKTPVVRVANSRFRLNMFAAISPEGGIYFMVHEGRGTAERFCQFLENTLRESGKKIFVVVDNCSIHKAKKTKEWVAEHAGECEIFYLPTYSPEVNPVELTWALVKREVSQQLSKTKAQMRANLEAALASLKESPEQVQAFFREADCKYILASIPVT